jgi:hypothetical protein
MYLEQVYLDFLGYIHQNTQSSTVVLCLEALFQKARRYRRPHTEMFIL